MTTYTFDPNLDPPKNRRPLVVQSCAVCKRSARIPTIEYCTRPNEAGDDVAYTWPVGGGFGDTCDFWEMRPKDAI